MAVPWILARYRPAIEAELRSVLAGRPDGLYHMLRYHLGWHDADGRPSSGAAGKALRPALCLFICEALAGDYRPALPAAASVELLHNASLIHDDIQDEDRQRRHRPTVWALWGKAQALNAGNALASLSALSLQRLASAGVPAQRRRQAHQLLYETCLRLVEGQWLDLSFEGRTDVTTPEYLAMAELKTAAPIACALQMGALLAGADAPTIEGLGRCGRALGLAYQISDDLLGIYGDDAKTGKPVGSDIHRHKRSFLTVYTLEHAGKAARGRLAQMLAAPAGDAGHLAGAIALLDAAGARAWAARQVQTYCERAMAALHGAPIPTWAHDGLREIAGFLAQREA